MYFMTVKGSVRLQTSEHFPHSVQRETSHSPPTMISMGSHPSSAKEGQTTLHLPQAKHFLRSMEISRSVGIVQKSVSRYNSLLVCPERPSIIYIEQKGCDTDKMSSEIRAALVGACGRMGTMIVRRLMSTEGITVSAAFDLVRVGDDIGEVAGIGKIGVPVSASEDLEKVLKETKTDVLIDFTIAKATAVNAPIAAAAGVNLVIGTTGLSAEQKTAITDAVIKNKVSAVISSNYSIGVGIFFKLCREAAKNLGPDYDVEIIEAHHNQKKDAPSGTAMTAAEIISKELGGKEFVYGREGQCPRGKEIGIHAVRGGDIVGDHTVMFIGNSERIELRHQAHSREVFVSGAVLAAKWVPGQKKGVVYDMNDVLA